jgi:hypothetical protein
LLPLRLTKRWRTPRDHGRDVALDLGNRLQSRVPSALQLASDEPIGWINCIVLSTGMGQGCSTLYIETVKQHRSPI